MRKKLKPVHPGEVLREEYLAPLKLSMNKLALDLRVPATRIAEIVHERRGITPDTALRLGRYFNTTAQFWMNLQTTYDLEMAEDTRLQKINREVQPARPSPSRLQGETRPWSWFRPDPAVARRALAEPSAPLPRSRTPRPPRNST